MEADGLAVSDVEEVLWKQARGETIPEGVKTHQIT
jgi:hypothetical protein